MANELKHKTAGGELTQAEFEDVLLHVLDSQAAGDVIYASSTTQLSRLAKGSDGEVLTLASGVPSWAAAAGGATLTVAETEVFNDTSSTSWTDLDLSGTVGSQATLVILKVYMASGCKVAVRKDGDTDEFYHVDLANYAAGGALAYSWDGISVVLIVATSDTGVIEWRTESAKTTIIDIIAYIK